MEVVNTLMYQVLCIVVYLIMCNFPQCAIFLPPGLLFGKIKDKPRDSLTVFYEIYSSEKEQHDDNDDDDEDDDEGDGK